LIVENQKYKAKVAEIDLERSQYKDFINEHHMDEFLIAMRNGRNTEMKPKIGLEDVIDDQSAINLIQSLAFNNTALTESERKQLETLERMFQDKVNALLKMN
jgi:hypothetical protein